jgi:phospholipid/cholesterol/gamma-HCH transport system ATP-binding protein
MVSEPVASPVAAAVMAPPGPTVPTAPLRAEDLTLAHGERIVQQALSFELQPAEVLVVAGASGCGKSTLLRHLVGLQAPAAGRVWHGGVDFHAAPEQEQSQLRQRFGVLFQGGALWSSMSVGDNVMLPLRLFTQLTPRECEASARLKLALVGLGDAFDRFPAALSGGMKKRAAMARALALDPPMLFLDEPSAGLDPLSSAQLDELIGHLRDAGTAIVMVTHELDSIFATADRLLFLDVRERTMTALGPPRELLAGGPPAVREFLSRNNRSASRTPAGSPTP